MNNPELYVKTNELAQQEAREFLSEYFHLIKWKQDGSGSAMDIGCGPGNCTIQILLPMLPESVRVLVATDLSPRMIQYARHHHQHPRVIYDVLDIATKELPAAYRERFDQVFSLLCLHWVPDQRQAMQNIFDMLQPGGDVLLMYFSENSSFEVLVTLAELDHWKPYMTDSRNYVAVHHMKNMEETLYSILHDVGFVNITCHFRRKKHVFANMKTFTDAMTAVNPFIPQLPVHLKEKYREELCSEHKIQANAEGYINNGTGSVSLPYTMIMIHARKP